jgi:uncharacterized protein (TIGR01319 family)
VERHALLVDIGSTFTKGVLVDLGSGALLSTGRVPSTVNTDVRLGIRALRRSLLGGRGEPEVSLACSSAAGGLHIVASGLVPNLTVQAARQAALGAGGKVTHCFSYKLTADDLAVIGAARPDIILLSGGTDGGDEAVLLANARALADGLAAQGTIVVAGNRVVSPEAVRILQTAGWDAVLTDNVLPELSRIEAVKLRALLRRLFLENIIKAKGIAAAAELVDGVIMPTPSAVLAAAEVVTGRAGVPGLFTSACVVDVGGATTDVVSVSDIDPPSNFVRTGLDEPVVVRTVEGDLGVRHNADSILEMVGRPELPCLPISLGELDLDAALDAYRREPGMVPTDEAGIALDGFLTSAAVAEASSRHAGTIEEVYVPGGPEVFRLRGKDLRSVPAIIGTGGPLTSRKDAAALLSRACYDPALPESLRPLKPEIYLDSDYLLFAVGLLSEDRPEVAVALARASLRLSAASMTA